MLSSVYGSTGIECIIPPYKFPHNSIFRLEMKYEETGYEYIGTACMIHENLAITTAHNVLRDGKEAIKLTCYLKLGLKQKGYKKFSPTAYGYLTAYKKNPSNHEKDYAVLYFPTDNNIKIGKEIGYLSIMPYSLELQGYISGYPVFINGGNKNEYNHQYKCLGKVVPEKTVTDSLLCYESKVSGGHSGSPFKINYDQNKWKMVGLHVAGSKKDIRWGVMMTIKLRKTIKYIGKQLEQLNGNLETDKYIFKILQN